jgi:type II secretory pathway component PulF
MFRWITNIFFAITMGLVIFVAIVLFHDGDVPPMVPWLFLATAFLAITAWASGLTRLVGYNNRRQVLLVLAYLEQAVRLNLPLPQMLRAAEQSESAGLAFKLHQLLAHLELGESISSAMMKAVPATPPRTLALLGAAERSGHIGMELDRLVRQEQRPSGRNITEQSFIRTYPVSMLVMLCGIISMVMIFVIPKYQRILADFKTPIPPVTQGLINVAKLITDSWPLQMLVLLVAAVVVIYKAQRSVGLWKAPIWMTTSRQYSDVCHVIGTSMAAGMPMQSAVLSASELSISTVLRARLVQCAEQMQLGVACADAARNAGIPRLIVGLTGTASTQAAVEAFAFLSRYYATRFSRLSILLHAAAVPAMVFCFGFVVAFVALALFMPMIAMLDHLSGGLH